MNQEYAMKAECANTLSGGFRDRQSPTLAENIDSRILHLEADVIRLRRVKELLATPGGILNVPIDDLRFAMNY